VLYDHENRLRSLEGAPPLTIGEFLSKATPQPTAKQKRKR
jgi:hypothetical protein